MPSSSFTSNILSSIFLVFHAGGKSVAGILIQFGSSAFSHQIQAKLCIEIRRDPRLQAWAIGKNRFDKAKLTDCVFNNPYNFLWIKGFFNKCHGIFNSMVAIDSADNNYRYIF